LAASILAHPTQRPLSESHPVEKIGLPHFLHVIGSAITTNFMITSHTASYKQETNHLVLANQSPQNGLIADELQKAEATSVEGTLAILRRFMIRGE
jgi:hypothetical protein